MNLAPIVDTVPAVAIAICSAAQGVPGKRTYIKRNKNAPVATKRPYTKRDTNAPPPPKRLYVKRERRTSPPLKRARHKSEPIAGIKHEQPPTNPSSTPPGKCIKCEPSGLPAADAPPFNQARACCPADAAPAGNCTSGHPAASTASCATAMFARVLKRLLLNLF